MLGALFEVARTRADEQGVQAAVDIYDMVIASCPEISEAMHDFQSHLYALASTDPDRYFEAARLAG